ncbi:MAG: hypothetical protein IIA59_06030 [Candidatus Marinimicrobia bacterium]|nr:hypothetical protein [Candidatus Neomarinimicrobiota bacterium]
MSRKKARKKKKARRRVSTRKSHTGQGEPKGFDFGCLPFAMAAGVYDFPDKLREASIVSVAYGFGLSSELDQMVPTISLIAENGEPLSKAFETFNSWSDVTDPDSLELTIIFRNNGGYLLALSPEYSRLARRCLGFDRTHRLAYLGQTWCKPIDTLQLHLIRIRDYSTQPIAPFLFDGATVVGSRLITEISSGNEIQPIDGLKPLLKFEVTFVDEEKVEPGTPAWTALEITSSQSSSSENDAPLPIPENIASQRVKTLRSHFPVTLERLRRSNEVSNLISELAKDGIAIWQIEQAICNLILSQMITGQFHYQGIASDDLDEPILEALDARYEVGDASTLPELDIEIMRRQILFDSNALLRYGGNKEAKDLDSVIVALRKVDSLEAKPAITDIPDAWLTTL